MSKVDGLPRTKRVKDITDQGFQKIYHNGEEVLADLKVDDSTSTAYYQHIYRATFGKDIPKRHVCLQWGHWCWKQAREYPWDAVRYLFGRLEK